MKRFPALTALVLLATSFCLAQEKAKDPGPPPDLAKALENSLALVEREVVPLAEEMPADKYSFVPTQGEFKGVRTFAEQVRHIAAANYVIFASVLGEKPPVDVGRGDDGPEDLKSKDEILKYLRDSFDYGRKAIRSINQQNATQWIDPPFGTQKTTRLNMATLGIGHCFSHYGQMVVYLRMNGMVPPASRPQSSGQ